MRNRKRNKTIEDFSVSQLLDDFIREDAHIIRQAVEDLDDEEYIRMMLKKDAQRRAIRSKREAKGLEQNGSTTASAEIIDDAIQKRFFPEVSKLPTKKPSSPPEEEIVTEILDSLVVKDVSELATKMKLAVDYVQEEMGTSESERRLIEALEQYRRPTQSEQKRTTTHISNDNVLVLKRCQNCYYSKGEKRVNGSIWSLCINPQRTPEIEVEDSWVKSGLNLSCWKASQKI
jgi:hypothetical protein